MPLRLLKERLQVSAGPFLAAHPLRGLRQAIPVPSASSFPAETRVLPFLGMARSAFERVSAFVSALELRSVFPDVVSAMTRGT